MGLRVTMDDFITGCWSVNAENRAILRYSFCPSGVPTARIMANVSPYWLPYH